MRAFLVYVRPEHERILWSPRYKQDIEAIECVQRIFTKSLPGLRWCTYSERLKNLSLTIVSSYAVCIWTYFGVTKLFSALHHYPVMKCLSLVMLVLVVMHTSLAKHIVLLLLVTGFPSTCYQCMEYYTEGHCRLHIYYFPAYN